VHLDRREPPALVCLPVRVPRGQHAARAARGYRPVALCSGTFTAAGVKWGTPEKEVLEVLGGLRRGAGGSPVRHHVLRPAGAHLYVDHHNMAACYNIVLGANHVAAGRVSRWAASLTSLPLMVHQAAPGSGGAGLWRYTPNT
jgi:hypothetical protein